MHESSAEARKIALFNPEYAAALAAHFLAKARDRTLNDLVLMKLLYLTERQFMFKYGAVITGSDFVSMKNGPVLLDVYRLMKSDSASGWHDYIEFIPHVAGGDSNHLKLIKDVPADWLSDAERSTADEIWKQYGSKDKWELVDLTHTFKEWDASVAGKDATVKRTDIRLRSILMKGYDMSFSEANEIVEEIEYYRSL
ncbi:MAG: Panacea domain-containing protein [Pseudomonadota bacterium]